MEPPATQYPDAPSSSSETQDLGKMDGPNNLQSYVLVSKALDELKGKGCKIGNLVWCAEPGNRLEESWHKAEDASEKKRREAKVVAGTRAISELFSASPFCVSGCLRNGYSCFQSTWTKLWVRPAGSTNEEDWADCDSMASIDLKKLRSHCVPSPFGDRRTQTTVYDESVRLAKECSNFKFTVKGDQDPFWKLKEVVDPIAKWLGREPTEFDIVPHRSTSMSKEDSSSHMSILRWILA